ncbi:MAG TPA: hypothetical protein VGH54_13305 [Mycobacterium sp.]|uniref:hypothetical protein n=1 Tax=Mycobacterium sp. TaxID=1785 RepID=UPI002F3FF4BA
MTPTTPGASDGTTPPDAGVFSQSLVPFPTQRLPGLPTPHDTRVELVERLLEAVVQARKERTVHGREDTFALIRSVQAFDELMAEYAAAFTAVTTTGKGVIEDELFTAVGDSDGIPTSGMTVPQAGGDIQITRKTHNDYFVDLPQVIAALSALVSAEWAAAFVSKVTDITPSSDPEQFACAVALRACEFLGAAKPKVTKVRGLAHDLAAAGEDQLAAVVSDAITKNLKYDGIDVKRVNRKPAA